MKIIFMGSPAFALPALEALTESSKHEVVAVYTNPPRASGRGQRLNKTAIHQFAEDRNLLVYTPNKLTNEASILEFESIDADIVIVAAYGKILRKRILENKKYGCINIHPSKLPRWRGAAPIQNTIMAGDKDSAVCIMQMDEGLDTGDVLLQEDFAIYNDMTAKELHDFTSELGAKLLLQTLDLIESGKARRLKQKGEPTYAEKVSRETEKIDWNKSADQIRCLIRGLSPYPGAYFIFKKSKIKIITAKADTSKEALNSYKDAEPGTVVDEENLVIKCGSGLLIPKLVKREGKKMIYTKAFTRGFSIPKGTVL